MYLGFSALPGRALLDDYSASLLAIDISMAREMGNSHHNRS